MSTAIELAQFFCFENLHPDSNLLKLYCKYYLLPFFNCCIAFRLKTVGTGEFSGRIGNP